MDVDSSAPGQDFVSILEARVAECDVLLALIGRGWLAATDAAGRRRLDNPEDFVRIEIATALTQAKRVIPVLIDDVPMPRSEDLPEVLKPLARRQATRLGHERFKADSDRLIRALKQVLADAETVRREDEARRETRPPAPSPTPDGMSESRKSSLTPTIRPLCMGIWDFIKGGEFRESVELWRQRSDGTTKECINVFTTVFSFWNDFLSRFGIP